MAPRIFSFKVARFRWYPEVVGLRGFGCWAVGWKVWRAVVEGLRLAGRFGGWGRSVSPRSNPMGCGRVDRTK